MVCETSGWAGLGLPNGCATLRMTDKISATVCRMSCGLEQTLNVDQRARTKRSAASAVPGSGVVPPKPWYCFRFASCCANGGEFVITV